MKWKFLAVTEDYDLYGTNDEEHAKECSKTLMVWNMETGLPLTIGEAISEVPTGWHTNPDTGKYWGADQ